MWNSVPLDPIPSLAAAASSPGPVPEKLSAPCSPAVPAKPRRAADMCLTLIRVDLAGGVGPAWCQQLLRRVLTWILIHSRIMPVSRLVEEGRFQVTIPTGSTTVSTLSQITLSQGSPREYALPIRVLFGREEISARFREQLHVSPN